MQQHPIPQNISTYQFRLIGDMTIKQFIMLSIGLGIAILIAFTNLFVIIKGVLIVLSVTIGFAVAFMPYEERTLDQWFIAYVRAIYAPTHFIWFKNAHLPEYFTFTSTSKSQPIDYQQLAEAARFRKEQGLSSFLMTLPEGSTLSKIEQGEKSQLNQISMLFSSPSPIPTSSASSVGIVAGGVSTQYGINALEDKAAESEVPEEEKKDSVAYKPSALRTEVKTPKTLSAAPIRERALTPSQSPSLQTTAVAQPFGTTLATRTANQSVQAVTSIDLPFPSTPTTPNTIVGMILSTEGRILENAIIEIRDKDGIPVRATKSNRLGQFFSTTPLRNGEYEIEVDKEGHSFAIIKLELTGQIVHPLKIQAMSEV